jgi:hypothetical protein
MAAMQRSYISPGIDRNPPIRILLHVVLNFKCIAVHGSKRMKLNISNTHAKISHLLARLSTSRQRAVTACSKLLTSLEQLLTLVTTLLLLSDLLQGCSNKFDTS